MKNITINGNTAVNATRSNLGAAASIATLGTKRTNEVNEVNETKELTITESTTLGELLKLLNLGEKPCETPTPKKLRENAGKPVAFYPMPDLSGSTDLTDLIELSDTNTAALNIGCIVYSNGFAVYDNGSGRTVLWLPDCTSFTYVFTRPKATEEGKLPYKEQISDETLESLSWFTAVMLIGDHRVESNILNRKSSRKGSRAYDVDDCGDKCGKIEAAIEDSYMDKFFWAEGRFGENPLDALIREERYNEMLEVLTDKQRTAFHLYYKEGYTQQQIAEMMGCVVSMVNKHLSVSLKKINKFF